MGKIAFVFSGQGAQYPGMGKDLYDASSAARRALDEAERIRPGTLEQCFEGPEEALRATINTQPCLFAVDYACAAAAQEAGLEPAMAAGFSLGEVAAAAFAGMLSFERAFRLVMRRAELMQEAAERHPGAMGAVLRLSSAQVETICAEFPGQAYPVNYNCPGQTVVACALDAFEQLSARVARQRGRVMRLNVSGAFHSPWMAEAAEGLRAVLAQERLVEPCIPLYANATALPYAGDLAELLARQVCSPVRWQETVARMAETGADAFLEVGAGATLTGLIKKTLEAPRAFSVSDAESLQAAVGGLRAW